MFTFLCFVLSALCFTIGIKVPSTAAAAIGLFWAVIFIHRFFKALDRKEARRRR